MAGVLAVAGGAMPAGRPPKVPTCFACEHSQTELSRSLQRDWLIVVSAAQVVVRLGVDSQRHEGNVAVCEGKVRAVGMVRCKTPADIPVAGELVGGAAPAILVQRQNRPGDRI